MRIPRKQKIRPKYYTPPSSVPYAEKERYNTKFYQSTAWRKFRAAYILELEEGQGVFLEGHENPKVQSLLDRLPICEKCLRNYLAGSKKEPRMGKQLDHIDPLNPDDAYDSERWGAPLEKDNVQLLCASHHAAKSSRDRKIIGMKKKS
jgi:hypothetical protein